MMEHIKTSYTCSRWIRICAAIGLIACAALLFMLTGGFPPAVWRFLFSVLLQLPQLWAAQGSALLLPLLGLLLQAVALLIVWSVLLTALYKMAVSEWHTFHSHQTFARDLYEAEQEAVHLTEQQLVAEQSSDDETEIMTQPTVTYQMARPAPTPSIQSAPPPIQQPAASAYTPRRTAPLRASQGQFRQPLTRTAPTLGDNLSVSFQEQEQAQGIASARSSTRRAGKNSVLSSDTIPNSTHPVSQNQTAFDAAWTSSSSDETPTTKLPYPFPVSRQQRTPQEHTSNIQASGIEQAQGAVPSYQPLKQALPVSNTLRSQLRIIHPNTENSGEYTLSTSATPESQAYLFAKGYRNGHSSSTNSRAYRNPEPAAPEPQTPWFGMSAEMDFNFFEPTTPDGPENEHDEYTDYAEEDDEDEYSTDDETAAYEDAMVEEAEEVDVTQFQTHPAQRPLDDTSPFHALLSSSLPVRLEVGIGLDPGITRKNSPNEDSLFAIQGMRITDTGPVPAGLFVIADGMGGHANGREASRTAIHVLSDAIVPALLRDVSDNSPQDEEALFMELLKDGVHRANLALYRRNREMPRMMGTTLTAALIVNTTAYIVNIGDSRTYLYSVNQGLQQITRDHSIVARLVEDGTITPDDIYTHPQRNQIYRCLGEHATVEMDSFIVHMSVNDLLLLCSDGVWEMIRDNSIEKILASGAQASQISSALVQRALHHGGVDNISVVVVNIVPGGE